MKKFRTPLNQVRGLGSAKEGTHHWWMQRVTAAALVPLSVWFVVSLVFMSVAEYSTVLAWVSSPLITVLLLCLIWALFHHAQLGVQVVLEDYVHAEWLKIASIVAVKFAAVVLGLACAIAVLKISLGG